MTEQVQQSVGELERELEQVGKAVEEAAVAGDHEEFIRLLMRERAIPVLIRQQKAAPHRKQVERLEAELERLDEDMRQAKSEPARASQAQIRRGITGAMNKNHRLSTINSNRSETQRQLRQARARAEAAENGDE